MAWTLVAFFLAMGIGAHALDELRGRPLATRIPVPVLWTLGVVSVAGAVAIGIVAALAWTPWLLVFVAAGGALVFAYNLELFGGRIHGDLWFALGWGAFPLLTAYFAAAERIRWEALVAAAFAALLSHVQRTLSKPVRDVRRRVRAVSGEVAYEDGHSEPVTLESLMGVPEKALRLLAATVVLLAAALVLLRVR